MSRRREYSWGIQSKLSLTSGVLVLLSLASFAWLSYVFTKRTLDDQMGQRLVSHAKMTAASLKRDVERRIISPDINILSGPVYSFLQKKLNEAKESADLYNIVLIGNEHKVLVDANQELVAGEPYAILRADEVELRSVWEGNAKASLLYPGKRGGLYKAAYAPVMTNDGKVVAVIRAEASANFLNVIQNLGLILFLSVLVVAALAALLGMIVARTIVVPIKQLAQASQIVADGDLDTEVNIKSRDEIGFFARTFNDMVKNLKESYDEVEQHGRQIAELSASVAHEVRNSISIIQGFTEVLQSDLGPDSPLLEYTGDIIEEVRMLNSKITDLINFAKPLEIEATTIDIVEVLESTIVSIEKEARDNNVSIVTNFGSNIPDITGDFEHLRGLFINLVRNAIQSIENGGGIVISTNIENNPDTELKFLEIKIEDTGCGMSLEAIDRAFEPFYTTKGSGTGLGLAIAKKIIDMHNGRIKLESVLQQGTTVYVFLPIDQ